MLFSITANNKKTCAGVLEFTSPEGRAMLPRWMMDNLGIRENDLITITSVSLQKASYVKIQPHETAFIDIANPKAVLETALRNFACLTEGDVICIYYLNKTFKLSVLACKPATSVSVIETDMQVDFAEPRDAAAIAAAKPKAAPTPAPEPIPIPRAVSQPIGYRLDGKPISSTPPSPLNASPAPKATTTIPVPTTKGKTTPTPAKPKARKDSDSEGESDSEESEEKPKFVPFSGKGYSLT